MSREEVQDGLKLNRADRKAATAAEAANWLTNPTREVERKTWIEQLISEVTDEDQAEEETTEPQTNQP